MSVPLMEMRGAGQITNHCRAQHVAVDKVQHLNGNLNGVAADLLPTILARVSRKGRGGRTPAVDARTIPGLDPKKAKRIMANRESAARSKLKQKVREETLKVQHEMRIAPASEKDELCLMRRVCQELQVQNKHLEARVKQALEGPTVSDGESDAAPAHQVSGSSWLPPLSSAVSAAPQGQSTVSTAQEKQAAYGLISCLAAMKENRSPADRDMPNRPNMMAQASRQTAQVKCPSAQLETVVKQEQKSDGRTRLEHKLGGLEMVHLPSQALKESIMKLLNEYLNQPAGQQSPKSFDLHVGYPEDTKPISIKAEQKPATYEAGKKRKAEEDELIASGRSQRFSRPSASSEHLTSCSTGLARSTASTIEGYSSGGTSNNKLLLGGQEAHTSPHQLAFYRAIPVGRPDGCTVQALVPNSSMPPVPEVSRVLPRPGSMMSPQVVCPTAMFKSSLKDSLPYTKILHDLDAVGTHAVCGSASASSRLQPRSIPQFY